MGEALYVAAPAPKAFLDLAGDIHPEFVLDSIAELPERWPEMAASLQNA